MPSPRGEQDEVICAVCGCVNAVLPVSADPHAHPRTCDVSGCGCEGMSVNACLWEPGNRELVGSHLLGYCI